MSRAASAREPLEVPRRALMECPRCGSQDALRYGVVRCPGCGAVCLRAGVLAEVDDA